MTVAHHLAVQFRSAVNRIFAGHVNDAGDDLVGEVDVTDTAVNSVAEFVINAFDGALELEYDNGITYQIQVVKISPPAAAGTRMGLHAGGLIVGYAEADSNY
ncbi:hypothetical protein [Mycobacterium sp.]|uniref:DUF7446 family protein n=1 Tax=Mycobacterium sp. TaxID=1785 RepID=UPI0025F90362|nr:hypothetical protein [Mycobacterium sp.]